MTTKISCMELGMDRRSRVFSRKTDHLAQNCCVDQLKAGKCSALVTRLLEFDAYLAFPLFPEPSKIDFKEQSFSIL